MRWVYRQASREEGTQQGRGGLYGVSVALFDKEIPAGCGGRSGIVALQLLQHLLLELGGAGPFYEGFQHATAPRVRCNSGQVLGGQVKETVKVLCGSLLQ